MQYLSRSVCWFSAFVWGVAITLVVGQAVGDVPAPIGVAAAIIAATLTFGAARLDKREAPAKAYEPAPLPAPLRVAAPCDEPTVGLAQMAGTTMQLHPIAGRVYRSMPLPAPSTVPRPRATVEAATTGGHDRAYFQAFGEISEEVLGPRDDDPPDGAETVQ